MHTLKMSCTKDIAAEAIEVVTFGALNFDYGVKLLSKWLLDEPVKPADPRWKLSSTSEEVRISNPYVKTEIIVQLGDSAALVVTITTPSRSTKRLMDAFQKWDRATIRFDGDQAQISTIRELLARELDMRPVPRS